MLLGTEMYALGPTSLTWQTLQARTAPTAEQVAGAVRQALAACDPERTSATQTTDTIDVVLLDTFGPWVSPWRWDGFTQAWCCPGHSVRRSEDGDDEPTVTRAVRAVLEWSDFIDALSVVFDERTAEDKGLPLSEATERAASRLLPLGSHASWPKPSTPTNRGPPAPPASTSTCVSSTRSKTATPGRPASPSTPC